MRTAAVISGLLVTLLAGEAAAQRWSSDGWVMLGENVVAGHRDFETIEMGRGAGRFRKLMIVVHDAEVLLQNFTVTFHNGETFRPSTWMVFRGESRTIPIDLPGDARGIDRITYLARDLRSFGMARVQVWGEKASAYVDDGGGARRAPYRVPEGWALLGEERVHGRRDFERIPVRREAGRFKRILIVVHEADVVLDNLSVRFHGGETFSPSMRMLFRAETRSYPIDLPDTRYGGEARAIEEITYLARDLRSYGTARVQVWGEQARWRAGDPGSGMADDEGWRERRGWSKLGETAVHGRADTDTIWVTRGNNRYRRMMFHVEGGDVEIYDMVITFANGETFRPDLRHQFRDGQDSRAIDLPGDTRMIQKIQFTYGNSGRHGDQARLEVWGR
jgi:hypothetical protein